MQEHFFKVTQGQNVAYGYYQLWDNKLPEDYQEWDQAKKEEFRPTAINLVQIAKAKNNHLVKKQETLKGSETENSDAIAQLKAFLIREWGWTGRFWDFKSVIDEQEQQKMKELFTASDMPAKDLKKELESLSYI